MIPLVALMQIENCNVAVSDPYEVYKVWSDFKVVPLSLIHIYQQIVSGNLIGKDRSTLKFWKSEVFNRPFLIQQEGKYKGYPLRTRCV